MNEYKTDYINVIFFIGIVMTLATTILMIGGRF